MKMTDGLFHKVFDEIGAEYPDIEKEHWIVDIGAAKLADTPEAFDVIVMPNLYGDILSDVAAQIAGSVGLAGSANIGEHCAMFEAIHGSAPRRAGQNLANPSGLLLGAVMMLVHIGQPDVAERVHNAWLRTIEDGVHTYDIYEEGVEPAEGRHAGVRRGGRRAPRTGARNAQARPLFARPEAGRRGRGGRHAPDPEAGRRRRRRVRRLAQPATPTRSRPSCCRSPGPEFKLTLLTLAGHEGVARRPAGDVPRATSAAAGSSAPTAAPSRPSDVVRLLSRITDAGLLFVKTEGLFQFDGERGYSLGQGE